MALLEFACPRTVELPALAWLFHSGTDAAGALRLLAGYNAAACLPLAAFGVLTGACAGSAGLQVLRQRHPAADKLALAGIFLALFLLVLTRVPL